MLCAGTSHLGPSRPDQRGTATDRRPAVRSRRLGEKDAACARLKRIGTDQSVPALAALLTDEQLSHSARYALESMPSAKAGQALTDALAKTSGLTKVGIINSLGFRRETRAVPALARLLTDQDAQVAAAAATALGQIGGSKALKALQHATANSAGPVHDCGGGRLAARRQQPAGSREPVEGAADLPGAL